MMKERKIIGYITFQRPYWPQPSTRTKEMEAIMQQSNKAYCDLYQQISGEFENTLDKIKYIRKHDPKLYKSIKKIGRSKQLYVGHKKIKKYIKNKKPVLLSGRRISIFPNNQNGRVSFQQEVKCMSVLKNVSKVYKHAKQILIDDSSKIVLMSDCHRSDGSGSDNFTQNQNICSVALNQYYDDNYTYIELGDGDELWENKDFSYIAGSHNNIFEILTRFYQDDRFYMIYGNHDMVKKNNRWVENNLYQYSSECGDQRIPLFPNIKLNEGIILTNEMTKNNIFLVHGHQVDHLNYNFWKLSRFLVRYFWRPLEMIGINDPTSPKNNYSKKNVVEQHLNNWAIREKQMIIAGHTHRLVFPKVGEALYFNDGCCVYPHYITAIEIANGEISIVKWSVKTRNDGVLFVGKDIVKGPTKIKDYFDAVCKKNEKRGC